MTSSDTPDVQAAMLMEAWDHYKEMVEQLSPNAAVEVFTPDSLKVFIHDFMVHQTAAYIFSTLCTPEQRVHYHHSVTMKLHDGEGYDMPEEDV